MLLAPAASNRFEVLPTQHKAAFMMAAMSLVHSSQFIIQLTTCYYINAYYDLAGAVAESVIPFRQIGVLFAPGTARFICSLQPAQMANNDITRSGIFIALRVCNQLAPLLPLLDLRVDKCWDR